MCDIICAGHICLDITPLFYLLNSPGPTRCSSPGSCSKRMSWFFRTGGSVANTGIALTKLGIRTALMGRVGDDIPGTLSKGCWRNRLGRRNISAGRGELTSYSVVLAPPGFDRMFLHNPAANHTLGRMISISIWCGRLKILHIGYPTCMKKLAQTRGPSCGISCGKERSLGSRPPLTPLTRMRDANGINADWEGLFGNVLPFTDIFMPSIEEALFMFDHDEFCRLKAMDGDILKNLDIDYLPRLGKKLLDMGAKIVVIKWGPGDIMPPRRAPRPFAGMGRGMPAEPGQWAGREIFTSIYRIDHVRSATGAGDTSIGGFLCGAHTRIFAG